MDKKDQKLTVKEKLVSVSVNLALAEPERDDRADYLLQYGCCPPPLFILLITIAQLGIFIYHWVLLSEKGLELGENGPVYAESVLIFNPFKKVGFRWSICHIGIGYLIYFLGYQFYAQIIK